MSSFNETYQEAKKVVTENEQLKYLFLVVAFACSVVAVFKVAEAEVNTWVAYAVTPDEKAFLKWTMAAISVFTPIVIPIVIILKKSGLQRWFWAGVPLATILSLFQLGSLCHVFLKMGHNSSEVHKKESMGTSALKSAIDRISGDTNAVVVDAGSDKSVLALEKNEQLAKEKTALLKCAKKAKGALCRKEHKANIEGLETELSGLSSYQSFQHESAQQKTENIKIALDLKNAADEDDAKVYAAPAFRFLTKDNNLALEIQKIASFVAAGVVWLFEAFSMFITGGLAASLRITQAFTGRVRSRLRSDDFENETDENTVNTPAEQYIPDPETSATVTALSRENTGDTPTNTVANTHVLRRGTSELLNDDALLNLSRRETEPHPPANPIRFVHGDEEIAEPAQNQEEESPARQPIIRNRLADAERDIAQALAEIRPRLIIHNRADQNTPPMNQGVSDAENTPVCIESDTDTANTPANTGENTAANTEDGRKDRYLLLVSFIEQNAANFFASEPSVGSNAVRRFIRANNMPCNQVDSQKAAQELLNNKFPQTREQYKELKNANA